MHNVEFGELPRRIFLLFIVFAMLSTSVLGNVVVFDKYESTYSMNGDILQVHKKLRLKNIGENPIIPGEIHFKVSQQQGGEVIPAELRELVIIDHYNKPIETKQVKGKKELDIIFTIWEPLLPSFHYDFQMDYEIDFDPKGLLFYEINIPTEKTTITIREQKTDFMLPKKYHVTFAPDGKVSSQEEAKVITWTDATDLNFEYSLIPLPKLGVRMVNIFWIILISISVLFLIIHFIRSRKQADDY